MSEFAKNIGRNDVMQFGILSTANIGKKLAIAMTECKDTNLVAVASRSFERAEEWIASESLDKLGVRGYGSYQALLDDPRIDAVYIPLPTTMHLEWIKKSAQAGKRYILCEKPIATTSKELNEMLTACKENNCYLMDGTMFIHHTRTKKLVSHLASIRFDEVHRAQSTFSFRGDDSFFKDNIRADSNLDPLGALGDLGWYCCRLSLLLFEIPPLYVKAECRKWSKDGKVPYDVTATIYYDNMKDRIFQFNCSFIQSFQQTYNISIQSKRLGGDGCDKIITCNDFVIPRSMMHTSYNIESHNANGPFADIGARVMSMSETIEVAECTQEIEMLSYLANLRHAENNSNDDDTDIFAKHRDIEKSMIINQALMDAIMVACVRGNGDAVKVEIET